MKHWIRLLSLVLCVAMLMGMAIACEEEPDVPEEPPVESENVSIIANGATTYRIVRSDLYNRNDPVTQAAVLLRQTLIRATGADVAIVTDAVDVDPAIPEILVGDTNRTVGDDLDLALEDNQYLIYFDGTNLLLTGNTQFAVEKAVHDFLATYMGYNSADGSTTKTDCVIPKDLSHIGSYAVPADVYVINDIRYINGSRTNDEDWNDMVRLYTSLQGRLNKDAQKNGFFVYQIDANPPFNSTNDRFWLDYIMGDGKLLYGSELIELTTWKELWAALGSYIKDAGIVVWDPNVPSTSNVAATICSVEGYLPVRYDTDADSMYTWLTNNGVEVKFDLCGMFTGKLGTKIADTNIDSTGSIKCDPYLWAMEKYMDRCSSTMLAYALDGSSAVATNPVAQKAKDVGMGPAANQLYSHDYYIYNECFFIDLTCVADEKPCDDPNQPMGTDARTLRTILSTMEERNNGQFTKLMGFPPWYMKYTTHNGNGKTEPVGLEWAFVAFITEYNFIKEADAWNPSWMTNASVYCQYQSTLPKYENSESELEEIFDDHVRYFSVYIGDYDSSAWLKNMVPGNFNSPSRGQIPLMWAFNPNLSDRVPMIFDYVYENKTDNDFFTTGDTGAGYVFPSRLKDLDMWIEYNEAYLEKFDMDIVGFIIDDQPLSLDILKAYAEITPLGAFTNTGTYAANYLTVLDNQTVFLREMDIYYDKQGAYLNNMYQQFVNHPKRNFAAFRTIVLGTDTIVEMIKTFENYANAKNDGYEYKYVDTYTLFDLILQSGQGKHVSSK